MEVKKKKRKNLIYECVLYLESVSLDYFVLDVQRCAGNMSYWPQPLICHIPAWTLPQPAEEQAQTLFCQMEGRPHERRRQLVLNFSYPIQLLQPQVGEHGDT